MKKLLIASLLAISCICTAAGLSACESDGLHYTLSDDGTYYVVEKFNDYNATEVEIPETYNDLPVTAITSSAFSGCYSLTSITIPDSITTIGAQAFYGCKSLTDITIPESVTYIGDYAFYECTSLTSISIPSGVTYIDNSTFYKCTSLTNISIPDSVTYISSTAFEGCNNLEYYTNNGGKYLGNATNNYLVLVDVTDPTVSSFTINSNTKIIYNSALEDCTRLTRVTIPTNVTCIGDYAFYNCSALTTLTVPNSVTYTGERAFDGCKSLEYLSVPDSVTIFESNAFWNCDSLEYYEYENGYYLGNSNNNYVVLVDVIDTSVTSFTINSKTKIIYDTALKDCTKLTSVIV